MDKQQLPQEWLDEMKAFAISRVQAVEIKMKSDTPEKEKGLFLTGFTEGISTGATAYAQRAYEEKQHSNQITGDNLSLRNEINRLEGEFNKANDLLSEAALQIKYLHEKFAETGSGNNVLTRIKTFLDGN